ncbi:OmpA family protein [Vibrio vulnificus]|nr:OmpA family protein [Vibrio vulnificus]
MKKRALFCSLSALLPGLALAETPNEDSAFFSSFWYVGASLSQGHFSDAQNDARERSSLNHIVDGLHVGHQFNPYLAAELEYQYLGNAGNIPRANELSGSYRQWVPSIKLSYPLTEKLSTYAKLGGAGWMNSSDEQGLSGVFGAGASYQVLDNLALRLEYQYTDSLGNKRIGEGNHQMGAIGVSYQFGRVEPVIIEKEVEVIVKKEVEVEKIVEKVVEVVKESTIVLGEHQQALFANNSSVLISTSALNSLVTQLKQHPQSRVIITGYTDSTGSAKYNQWLSERRARSAQAYLTQQGIAPNRIQAIGLGEASPIADNRTAEGRSMNRRVEIQIKPM